MLFALRVYLLSAMVLRLFFVAGTAAVANRLIRRFTVLPVLASRNAAG